MRKIFFILFLLAGSLFLSGQTGTGYEVDVTITGLRDSTVFLAYHFGEKQYIKDTTKLDKTGHCVFRGKEILPQGIYMVVLPGKKYFEILMSTDQIFSLTCSYTDYFNTLKFAGCDENTAFLNYQRDWMKLQQQSGELVKRLQNNKQNSDSTRILTDLEKKAEVKMKLYLKEVIKANNNNLLTVLLKAMLPIDVPDFKVSPVVKNPDSVKWIREYNYNKDHYFDNINLTDDRILRTPILYGKLNVFFTNVIVQSSDSINKEIDRLINKCKGNYKMFQYISVYLFNHFRESEIMGHDAVMVKLADDIYLSGKADWVTKEFKADLKKQIDLIRPNLIGKKAENLVMDSFKGIFVSLYDVEKEFTILYFWEPNCGHCKESTPKLKAYYDKVKNDNIEVFAVCTTSDKPQWTKYIEENKISWINGWDPDRNSHFDYYFNVQSTPMIYILDRNKKIIAKKLSVEDIEGFINNYRKYGPK